MVHMAERQQAAQITDQPRRYRYSTDKENRKEYRTGLLCTVKENRRGVQERSSFYSQRESKRSTGEVLFVQPKRIEEEYRRGLLCTAKENRRRIRGPLCTAKRIEKAYRTGLFCTTKENQRGVQKRSSLYSQRESKRHTGGIFFVLVSNAEEN
jgi:hypothetical protein